MFSDAREELAAQARITDPPSHLARDGVMPGQWTGFPYQSLPPDCPISVHGLNGNVMYVTDANGQLIEVERGDAVTITRLFGKYQNYPEWAFPRFGKPQKDPETGEELPPKINGLEYQKMHRCLVAEAGRKGLFDPSKQHRGRGGWLDAEGNFVWHGGEQLYVVRDGKLLHSRPGEHQGSLYTVQPSITKPWMSPVAREESPAVQLLADFKTWSWERDYLDPVLLVGWLVTALMGGALKWRPIIFTTGGAGVGKSTLHGIIEAVMGSAVMATADTTAAGIYQNIKQDSTGVIVDEFEASANMAKRQPVIDLARIAASGSSMFRGGADHTGTSFEVRCSFFFSAINVPQLNTADKSRMVILNLGKLASSSEAGREFVYSSDQGRMLLRQVMDGYKYFRETLLPDWKQMLHKADFNQRQVDTYGTLLAAAELVLGPEAMEDAGLPTTDPIAVGELIAAATKTEREEQLPNWQRCLEYLLDSPIELYRNGERPTVGGLISELQATEQNPGIAIDVVRKSLSLAGLGLLDRGKLADSNGYTLCVPNTHQQLNRLFANTEFAGEVWGSALKQGPSDFIIRNVSDRPGLTNNSFKVKIGLTTKHCVLIDLAAFQKWQAGSDD